MAIIDVEGWEGLNTAQALNLWSNATGGFTVGATGRRGSNGATLTVAGQGASITRAIAPKSVIRVEFAIFLGGLTAGIIAAFQDGSSLQCELRISGASGFLQVTRNGAVLATATDTPLVAGNWYHIGFEVAIHNSLGAFEVRVYNQPVGNLTQTNQDTQNTANSTADAVRLASQSASAAVIVDDIIISDDQGSAPHNDFMGNARIDYMAPDGAGNYTQWTPSAGSNWQNVDDNPADDDTTYNHEATVNDRDTYTMTTPAGSGTVLAVAPQFRCRVDDAGPAQVRPIARRAGVDGNGANVSPSELYQTYRQVWQTDPTDSTAWDMTKVGALEIGVQRTA